MISFTILPIKLYILVIKDLKILVSLFGTGKSESVLMLLLQAIVFTLETSHFLVCIVQLRLKVADGVVLGERNCQICVEELWKEKKWMSWLSFTELRFFTSKGFSGAISWIFAKTFVRASRTPCLANVIRKSSFDSSIGCLKWKKEQWKQMRTIRMVKFEKLPWNSWQLEDISLVSRIL